MTAKNRKKNKPNQEDFNTFSHESSELEARGGHQYALLLILFVLIVVGGATATWVCFQQHQTITYISDSIMGMQLKIVKLQSSQEEIRQTNEKKQNTNGFEHRLNALEESYMLAQKQVGMALATAEQLKASDLPAQVLSLHTEMKARLAEMQQSNTPAEQLQALLKGKSQEFEAVRLRVESLAGVSTELAQSVEGLTVSLAETEAMLEEKLGLLGTLSANMEGKESELLELKERLAANQAQLEYNTAEIAIIRELIESEHSQRAEEASLEVRLVAVQQSLKKQNLIAHSLHSELNSQLEAVQKRVAQLEGGAQADGPLDEEEESASAKGLEEEAPVEVEHDATAELEQKTPALELDEEASLEELEQKATSVLELEAPVEVDEDEAQEVEAPVEVEEDEAQEVEAPVEVEEDEAQEVEAPVEVEEDEAQEVEAPVEVEEDEAQEVEAPVEVEEDDAQEVEVETLLKDLEKEVSSEKVNEEAVAEAKWEDSAEKEARAPAEEDEGAPAEEDEGAPAEEDEGAPADEDEGAPAEEDEGAPAEEDEGDPAEEDEGAPAEEDEGAPAEEDEGAPAEEDEGAPAEEDAGAPAEEDEGAPAEEDAGAPAEEGEYAPAEVEEVDNAFSGKELENEDLAEKDQADTVEMKTHLDGGPVKQLDPAVREKEVVEDSAEAAQEEVENEEEQGKLEEVTQEGLFVEEVEKLLHDEAFPKEQLLM
ncbi:hypothetical protein UPYG_G00007980 [Umbra pygmaea]|uniref:Uncharacterized protein n=1 Tax=Umbra pygmaea TaxID=75934 RepID=A0ABD0XZ19_UMBPY